MDSFPKQELHLIGEAQMVGRVMQDHILNYSEVPDFVVVVGDMGTDNGRNVFQEIGSGDDRQAYFVTIVTAEFARLLVRKFFDHEPPPFGDRERFVRYLAFGEGGYALTNDTPPAGGWHSPIPDSAQLSVDEVRDGVYEWICKLCDTSRDMYALICDYAERHKLKRDGVLARLSGVLARMVADVEDHVADQVLDFFLHCVRKERRNYQ